MSRGNIGRGVGVLGAAFVLFAPATAVESAWAHSWDTAGAAYWGDFGYSLLKDSQAQFIAENYAVASLEKCTGSGQGMKTEAAIYQTAKQLKSFNPDLKVMFYWASTLFVRCYAANDTFAQHPEWILRDDYGNEVGSPDNRFLDWTNEAAAEWWVSVPLAGVGASDLIDGVLADSASFTSIPNISQSRLEDLYSAKLAMIGKLQAEFDKLGKSGVVFGNGLNEYDQSKIDPHGFRILDHAAGIQNEHFAAFEQVDGKTGKLDLDKTADTLANIEKAAAMYNGTKQIFCSFWAGPYTGFAKDGWPKYFDDSQPCGANNPTIGPNCTSAQRIDGWRGELEKYLPFNLAAFLSVAQNNTWFSQAVWYEDHQGFYTCPDAPDTCTAPASFYADYLKKPLGAPLGLRQAVPGHPYRWTRDFEHATVTVDLNDPVGSSSIVFH